MLLYSIRKTNGNCHSEIHLQFHEKVTHEKNLGPAKVALDSSTQPSIYLLLLKFFFSPKFNNENCKLNKISTSLLVSNPFGADKLQEELFLAL